MWTLPTAVAAVFLQVVVSQQVFPGDCPTPTVMDFKDAQRTTFTNGPWYEQKKYYAILEKGYDCVTWNFHSAGTAGAMTAHVSIRNSYIHTYDYMQDSLTPKTTDKADYIYRCTQIPVFHTPLSGSYSYQLLAYHEDAATPANSYAVAWSCELSGSGHEEILWILTRSRNYSDTVVKAAIAAVEATGVGLTVHDGSLVQTGQSGCTNLASNATNVFGSPKGEASVDKQELEKLITIGLNRN